MPRISGIYKITNLLNGKVYVGRSVDVHARWRQHIKAASGCSTSPIHQAIRKYGAENFDFTVLEKIEDNLPVVERQHINACDSYRCASGYNVGGTAGGWPTKLDMRVMDDARRDKWRSHYQIGGRKGIDSLKQKRVDSTYEAEYLQKMSAGGVKRERIIAARRAIDAEYDRKMHEQRSQATSKRKEGYQAKTGVAFKEKFSTDAEFKTRISANRKVANAKSIIARRENAWFEASIAGYMRKTGHTLQEIANETGKSIGWASVVVRGVQYAAVS